MALARSKTLQLVSRTDAERRNGKSLIRTRFPWWLAKRYAANLSMKNAYDAFDFELTPHNLQNGEKYKGDRTAQRHGVERQQRYRAVEKIIHQSRMVERKSSVSGKNRTPLRAYSRCRNNITALHIEKSLDWHFVSTFEIYDCRTALRRTAVSVNFTVVIFVRCNTAVPIQ